MNKDEKEPGWLLSMTMLAVSLTSGMIGCLVHAAVLLLVLWLIFSVSWWWFLAIPASLVVFGLFMEIATRLRCLLSQEEQPDQSPASRDV